ncbi:MAG: L-threonylcarbamoyladenylate synthase [Candidatus Pacearchaeota archaeon]|nr:L-threonylcarbamoyladenylate synthase [Candidatus Pacearchaeota archaeon]
MEKTINQSKQVKQILEGKIFIYPTDTIYGIGCNAYNQDSVEKIKQIKARDRDKPLSIIAPSFEWIEKNCIINVDLKKYLPGPYTILLQKKNPSFLNHVSTNEFLGIRIPKCHFSEKVKKAEVPFITTSINLSGEPFAKNIEEIPKQILDKVDVIIDEGELNGIPSTLIKNGKEISR